MNTINAFLLVFKTIIEVILKVLSPIFIVIMIWIIVSIIYRYKKYGITEFNIFKKREKTKFIDIVLSMLDKIEGYRKVYKPENFYADLVIIDKTGIYLLKLIKYVGMVTGNRKDKKLKNQVKLNEVLDIDNPFFYLDRDLTKIDNTLNVKLVLVTSNIANVRINGVSKEESLILKDFYYYMEHTFKQGGPYDKEKINEIYDELHKIK